MSLKFETSGAQTDGARDYQEDSFLTSHLQAGEGNDRVILAIVADGMGGHAAGNVASNLAVQAYNKYITSHYPMASIDALLRHAMEEANKAITSTTQETAALKGMGCTLVAALLVNEKMYWCSVGDSHLFHFHDNKLIKRNTDHSYGGYLDRMAAEGNPVTAENGYSRHMLLSALTGEPIPAIDSSKDEPVTLKAGDKILLCSDGLDTLSSEKIQADCKEVAGAKALSNKLLADVEAAGSPRQDNTTVITINVTSNEKVKPTISQTKSSVTNTKTDYANSIQRTQNRTTNIKPSYAQPARQSWFLPICIITLIAVGAWWYLSQKATIIADLVLAEKNAALNSEYSVPDHNQTIDENSLVDEKNIPEISTPIGKVEKIRDQLAKGYRGPEMVLIPAGSFQMGATSSTNPTNERPRHMVTLKQFAIGSKEITRGEFAQYSGIAVSNANSNQPVRNVSWKAAKKYTAWLSKQTGKIYRLPSEAEWEYAARAGTKSPFWWGYNVGVDNALCFGCGTPLEPTRPKDVGSYAANAFGLHDTAGNLAEWVEDCYHGNYQNAPSDGSVWQSKKCKERVIRGGAYTNAAKSLFVSRRDKLPAKKSKNYIGFRVVRED